MPDIKCTVKNCAFWGEGEICKASAVEVDNNINPGASSSLHNMGLGLVSGFKNLFDPKESSGPGSPSSGVTSSETCCKTMRPRV